MRIKEVKVADKKIVIVEKKIKELRQLSNNLSIDIKGILDTNIEGKTFDDLVQLVVELLEDKITIIFPELKEEDLENAYISEIEELIIAFLDVNFTGAKKVFSQVMKLALKNSSSLQESIVTQS